MIRVVMLTADPDDPEDGEAFQAEDLTVIVAHDGARVLWSRPADDGNFTLAPGDRLRISGWAE